MFKNSKGTVNLRNAPSPSGDLDTNTKYDYVNDLSEFDRRVSEILLAKKICKSFVIRKSDQSGSIKDVVLAVAQLAVAQGNTCEKVKMYQLDVAQGDTCAAFKLGSVYASGLFNVEKDDELALIYYLLAGKSVLLCELDKLSTLTIFFFFYFI